MPKSRRNKSRNENLLKYKNKHKKNMSNNQNQFQMPQTRQLPVWEANTLLTVTGKELQAFSELMDTSARAYAAYTNIVNRGLLEGTIIIQHEKLNKEGTDYEPMSEEESAPLQEQVKSVIAEAKKLAEQARQTVQQENSQEGLPRIDAIVDPTGEPATTDIVQKEEAKIVML